MEAREQLRQVAESIADHPGRVVASSMGVFWGAAAIVLLMAFGSGFREYMRAELDRYGKGAVQLFPASTSSGFPGYRKGVAVEIARADAAAAERVLSEELEALLPEHRSEERVLVEAGGRVRRLDLSASDERFAHYRNFAMAHGRFFDASDLERRRPVAVLGHAAAEDLFGRAAAAVGETLRIEGHSLEVIGVARPKGRQYTNTHRPDNRLLMVPVTTAESRLGYREQALTSLLLIPRAGVEAERAVAAVLARLGPPSGFHPEDADAVKWYDTTAILAMSDLFSTGFLIFVGVAGTITLLIGGVGIANYHLATLAERTVEIAVARAIGARTRTLMIQALAEAAIVSAGSALLGVLLGLAGCAALAALAPPGQFPRPIVSGLVLGVTLTATLAVAIVAGAVPASRVRRIEIAAALRSGG
ncbi:MAG: ABC transporter permease [Myxococcota bacterium]